MDKDNMTNWIIIAAVAVVLILGGWWLMQRGGTDSPAVGDGDMTNGENMNGDNVSSDGSDGGSTGTSTTGGTQPATTTSQGEAITVNDQPAGVTVTIANMDISRETWVAVRDERSILGAGRFAAGTESGTVELLRGTEAGKTYTVVVYVDNGNRAFDLTGDELVTGVSDTFTATGEATTGE